MIRRISTFILIAVIAVASAMADSDLAKRLSSLKGVSGVEKLESKHYGEKYLVRIEQPVDPKNPAAGTFKQRVVICHVGYDRPTIQVTEGYGGAYALRPNYQEELSKLLNANVVFTEYRYFLESVPNPCNWDYLTAENSAYDLHNVNTTFKQIYPGKWISTGISKGGQTTCLYRAFFPDDVDFSVPYVAPLGTAVEDGRHEPFLRLVGNRADRDKLKAFQIAVLKHRGEIEPMIDSVAKARNLKFRIPVSEVLDYSVLEYPFAFWQWGSDINAVPEPDAPAAELFKDLMSKAGLEYFAQDQPNSPFYVQAARELGYYGYDVAPFEGLLTIKSADGYLHRIMLPEELDGKIKWDPELYQKVYHFLKDNDPKMIFIYGEVDPWSATRVPTFPGKVNEQIYIQPGGSHRARISNMPEDMKQQIMAQIEKWLAE